MSEIASAKKKPLSPAEKMKNQLRNPEVIKGFTERLGSNLDVVKFRAQIEDQIRKSPNLLSCDPKSLFDAILDVASLGLSFGGHRGEAYLIPFKTTCTLVLGYRGLTKLAMRDPNIDTLSATLVYKNDFFQHDAGCDQTVTHRPVAMDEDRGDLIGGYAIVKLRDGSPLPVVMRLDELAKIEQEALRKAGGRPTPWKSHREEMLKKTLLRRACKLIPANDAMAAALEMEDQGSEMKDVTPPIGVAARIEQQGEDDEAPRAGLDDQRAKALALLDGYPDLPDEANAFKMAVAMGDVEGMAEAMDAAQVEGDVMDDMIKIHGDATIIWSS